MRRIVISLSVLLVVFGCRERKTSSDEVAHIARTTTPAPAAGAAPAPSSSATGDVTIRRADGTEVAVVHQSGQNVEIRYAGHVLKGEPRDTGKRKYHSGSGPVIFEIKPGDSGFKLRTADGALRWKVKISDDKIKISDNEENKNPFELKLKEGGDRVKVVEPGEHELGAVRGNSVEDASKKEVFRVDGGRSAAYGVLLLNSIPEDQRYILLAEILSRGR